MSSQYQLASTAVIHECLDGEVIAANLDTGIYYSMQGVAAVLWQLLLHEVDELDCIQQCKKHYPDAPSLKEAVSCFIKTLCHEQLLKKSVATAGPADVPEIAVWPSDYAPPALHKYEEMTQLLKLDPIHEVDEQGWPKQHVVE